MTEAGKVLEFLGKVKEKKTELLMGLTFDIDYYKMKIASFGDEDAIRDQISDEQEKCEKDNQGRIISDKRDMEKLRKLNETIGKLQKLRADLAQAEEVLVDLNQYMGILDNTIASANDLPETKDELAKKLLAIAQR